MAVAINASTWPHVPAKDLALARAFRIELLLKGTNVIVAQVKRSALLISNLETLDLWIQGLKAGLRLASRSPWYR